MKRKILGIVLVISMVMTACGSSAQDSAEAVTTPAEGGQEEQEPQMQEIAGQGEISSEEGAINTGGGSPWIDSDLRENITEGMELSPKDDFHLYVNYDWLSSVRIPEGYRAWSSFDEVDQITQDKAQDLFKDEEIEGHEIELVRDLYNACLDWDARNELGMEPVMEMVKKIQEAENIEAITDMITDFDLNVFLPIFISVGVEPGLEDSTTNITWVTNEGFLLGDAAEYETRTSLGDSYYEADKAETAALLARIGYEKAEAEGLFDAVIDLEAQLAEVSFTSADQMSPDYWDRANNIMTLSELLSLADNYPLEEMLISTGLDKSKQFLVVEPEYIKRLDELYTEKNLEAIRGYILIKYLMGNAGKLDREAYALTVERTNAINGSTGELSQDKYVYSILTGYLPEAVSQAYLAKYDSRQMKQDIEELCYEIIDYYRQMLSEEEWLSEETRQMAISKLDHMIVNAVYPDEWYDYSGLSLTGLSYFECANAINKFETERMLGKMNEKVDRTEWDTTNILESNAFYNPQKNSINIILGLLSGEFYREDMTREELLGGIGAAIGHEISHAFDTSGSQFDEEGNYADWWTEEDYSTFQEKADKLVTYYDGITVYEGQNVIGTYIQTESIADMAALKCLLAIAEEEEDFDYDAFFRQFASIWRRINTVEYEYRCLTQDTHPLHYLRTNVMVQQFDEFYETYDIKPEDNMYLPEEDRILVW